MDFAANHSLSAYDTKYNLRTQNGTYAGILVMSHIWKAMSQKLCFINIYFSSSVQMLPPLHELLILNVPDIHQAPCIDKVLEVLVDHNIKQIKNITTFPANLLIKKPK